MSRNYKFHEREGIYFVSFAVVEWHFVFTDNAYKEILLKHLRFCIKNRGMELFSWCIMGNHIHLIFRSIGDYSPESILGNFKRITSMELVKAIKENFQDKRRMMFLTAFSRAASNVTNVKHFQFWQHDNKPIELWSNRIIDQKIDYIHQNPVKAGLVLYAEDYRYSSAKDYAGEKGLIDGVVVV